MKTNLKPIVTIAGITMLSALAGQAQLNMTTDSTGLQVSLLNNYTITVGAGGTFGTYDLGIAFTNVMDPNTTIGYTLPVTTLSGGGLELNRNGVVTDFADNNSNISITYGGYRGADTLSLGFYLFSLSGEVTLNPGDSFTFLAGTYTATDWSEGQYGTLLNPSATYSANQYSVINTTELGPAYDASLMTVAPAPEPSTLALAALGGLGMWWQLRRQK
jgi:hypothetical protein